MAEISTQQIISCVTTDDDCNGGDLLTVFNYVMDAEVSTVSTVKLITQVEQWKMWWQW